MFNQRNTEYYIYYWNQYDEIEKISCLPLCNVTNTNKAYFFITENRIIIRISGKRVWCPLQEKEVMFSKNIFQKF